jgi:serine protease Do
VVSIDARSRPAAKRDTQQPQRRRPRIETFPPENPEDLFRRFFDELPDRDTDQLPRQSFGSGFIIDPKGVILTNYHVVDGADHAEIELKDGRKFTSKDIKGDKKNDLAIIRVNSQSPLPYLELGDSDAMEIGDRVLAVGAPFHLTGSVTAGIVSAKGRSGLNPQRVVYEDYLQTDAAINPGNSGGPLVNLEGKVVGINTAIRSVSGGFQGVGLAITSNLAKNIVEQLIREGVVHRGYIGVSVGPLDPDAAARLGVAEQSGVSVSRVLNGTPAAKAGIQELDIITAVGGKPVSDGRELQRLIARLPLRQPVDVTIVRDGKTKKIPVIIEEQPEEYGIATRSGRSGQSPRGEQDELAIDKIGIDVADLTPELASQYGFTEDAKGVVITSVQPGSIADEKGLRRGMLMLKIDKKSVTSAVEAKNALQKAALTTGVLLQVQLPERQGGGKAYVVLKDTGEK